MCSCSPASTTTCTKSAEEPVLSEIQQFVFHEPTTSAQRMGYVSSWVAVTGPARNGFLPVETPTGPRGWVMQETVERDTWINMKCIARRGPNGRVFFVYGGTPPGS